MNELMKPKKGRNVQTFSQKLVRMHVSLIEDKYASFNRHLTVQVYVVPN